MKTLVLVRHAKSSWKDPELADFDRPLNKRGRRDAPFMARAFAKRGLAVDALVSSSANRALLTARAFAEALGLEVAADRKYYAASVQDWMRFIGEFPESARTVVAFGHNPELTELANRLAGTEIDNVPTSGTVAVRFAAETWAGAKGGELLFFDYPKRHPELRDKA